MDWTEVLAAEDENPRARLAAELLASDAYGSTAERVQAFVRRGEVSSGDTIPNCFVSSGTPYLTAS